MGKINEFKRVHINRIAGSSLIIGILAGIALPQYQKAVNKASMSEAITLLKSASEAQRRYFLATGILASQWDVLDITLPNAVDVGGGYLTVNNGLQLQLVPNTNYVAALRTKASLSRMFLLSDITKPSIIYCCFNEGNEEAQNICESMTTDPTVVANLYSRKCYYLK